MSAKQISDKARFASLFGSLEAKSYQKALKNQSGKVTFDESLPQTLEELHEKAWEIQGNSADDFPTEEKKLKSARNSFASGLRKDVDRMLLRTTVLNIGGKEIPGLEWMKNLGLDVDDAADKVRNQKIGEGNSIVRLGIELPLPKNIASNGQRGRQACDPLAEMMSFIRK